ncbi:hypothetical protein APASM_6103 [Actinosynnema pretiosum subsp. pretiosum]|nr:hypothetical protein APASM_6103 [Actinosynnema pretiosum subsp. pretiosum]
MCAHAAQISAVTVGVRRVRGATGVAPHTPGDGSGRYGCRWGGGGVGEVG